MEVEISAYLTKVAEQAISHQVTKNINKMMLITTHIESIADSCFFISGTINRINTHKITLTDKMQENLADYAEKIQKLFSLFTESINNKNGKPDYKEIKAHMQKVYKYHNKLQEEHFKNLKKRLYKPKTGVVYVDIYSELTKIGEYTYRSMKLLYSLT